MSTPPQPPLSLYKYAIYAPDPDGIFQPLSMDSAMALLTTQGQGQTTTAQPPLNMYKAAIYGLMPDGSFQPLSLDSTGALIVSGGGGGNSSFINGFGPITNPNLVAALGAVKAGTGNARILMVGDSTTQGTGSNGSTEGNQEPLAWPTQLAAYLNSIGIPAQNEAFFGNGSSFESNCANNGKVNCGAWQDGTFTTVGGELFEGVVGAPLTFTPSTPTDSLTIWYTTFPGNGEFTVSIDGGAPQSINTGTGTSGGMASTTITTTLGMHVIALNMPAAGNVFVIGLEAWNSTISSVHILNAGWAGSQLVNWDDTDGGTGVPQPWAPLNAVPILDVDVVMIDLGINDWRVSTDAADWKTAYQAVLTAWIPVSDCVVITPNPSELTYAPGFTTAANMNAYVMAMQQLAATNSNSLLDFYSAFASWDIANSKGWMFDGLHPNAAGYAIFASLGGQGIQKAAGAS